MIIVKATKDFEAGVMPDEALWTSMASYHAQLAKAGVLLDRSGLKASSEGWRIQYDGETRVVMDGPFAEAKELIAGYTIIRCVRAKRRWSGRADFPILRLIAATPKLKCGKCLSRKISINEKSSNVFVRLA